MSLEEEIRRLKLRVKALEEEKKQIQKYYEDEIKKLKRKLKASQD